MKEKLSEHREVLEAIEYAIEKTDQEEREKQSSLKTKKGGMRKLAARTSRAKAVAAPRASLGLFLPIVALIGLVAAYLVWLLLGQQ
ncbi:MAG: hypothetical protein Q7Q71_02225 [Verrucomicrobiota bacterium JB023]|nr:hypothetical protein [Verrucomicrobiota bacterium JB023]